MYSSPWLLSPVAYHRPRTSGPCSKTPSGWKRIGLHGPNPRLSTRSQSYPTSSAMSSKVAGGSSRHDDGSASKPGAASSASNSSGSATISQTRGYRPAPWMTLPGASHRRYDGIRFARQLPAHHRRDTHLSNPLRWRRPNNLRPSQQLHATFSARVRSASQRAFASVVVVAHALIVARPTRSAQAARLTLPRAPVLAPITPQGQSAPHMSSRLLSHASSGGMLWS